MEKQFCNDEIWMEVDMPNIKKGMYRISNKGNLWSIYAGRLVNPKIDKYGYRGFSFSAQNKRCIYHHIANVVAYMFLGNPTWLKDPTIDHIDFNKQNDCVENLMWLERADNTRKYKGYYNVGDNCPNSVLSSKQVEQIRERLLNGERQKDIAKEFNVARTTITAINNNKTWKK